jgi:hypothetical protein
MLHVRLMIGLLSVQFTFYGSLGSDTLDNIAIDNVALGPDPFATTPPPTTLAPGNSVSKINSTSR